MSSSFSDYSFNSLIETQQSISDINQQESDVNQIFYPQIHRLPTINTEDLHSISSLKTYHPRALKLYRNITEDSDSFNDEIESFWFVEENMEVNDVEQMIENLKSTNSNTLESLEGKYKFIKKIDNLDN